MASRAHTLSTMRQASVPCSNGGAAAMFGVCVGLKCACHVHCYATAFVPVWSAQAAAACQLAVVTRTHRCGTALTQADHLRSRIAVLTESGVRTPYIRIAARE